MINNLPETTKAFLCASLSAEGQNREKRCNLLGYIPVDTDGYYPAILSDDQNILVCSGARHKKNFAHKDGELFKSCEGCHLKKKTSKNDFIKFIDEIVTRLKPKKQSKNV